MTVRADDARSPAAHGARDWHRTICCHCEVHCGVLVGTDSAGDPVAVRGDPDHPLTKGFICPRGRAAPEYVRDPRRLDRPLRRVGARGSGQFEEIGWNEALDDIARRLLALREQSGAEALAYLNGTSFSGDGWFGRRLLHQFGSPNGGGSGLMCDGPKMVAGALTHGFGAAGPDVVPGLTDLVVLWGHQPSASSVPRWQRMLEAVRAGARLVVVDPRPTLESRRAHEWLPVRPGTDAALALALLAVVIDEGLYDRGFVRRWTVGFDELAKRVAENDVDHWAAVTGVSPSQIRRVARLYAASPAAAVSCGSPNGQGRNALSFERAVASLVAITGKLDRPGCNLIRGPIPDVGSEVSYDAYGDLPPEQHAKRLGSERFRLHGAGVEMLSAAATRVWRIPYPISRRFLGAAHPLAIVQAILTGEPYPVRALLLQHHNAVGAYGGSDLVARALASPNLELLVAHDLFLTPTSSLADYVLPAASWMEKPFLLARGLGTPVIAGEQAMPARHDRRSDYELCRDLGRRLGQEWPERVEDVYDQWLASVGSSYDDFLATPDRVMAGAEEHRRHAGTDPTTGEPRGFATPSRKVELRSTVLAWLGYDPLPSYHPSFDAGVAEAYPIALMTGATRIDATHQDHRQVPPLRGRHPDPIVEIGPAAARAHGIEAGDWVRIVTPRGSVRQRARIVADLPPDRVSAERWWYPERDGRWPYLFGVGETNVNMVTEADMALCDPAYGALPFRVARCRIEREPAARDEPAAAARS